MLGRIRSLNISICSTTHFIETFIIKFMLIFLIDNFMELSYIFYQSAK
jgi:hypothetical protein